MVLQDSGPLDVSADQVGLGRPWLRAAMSWLAVGFVVGAVLGVLVGMIKPTTYQAVTTVSIQSDQAALATVANTGPATTDTTSFIQGELVILNGGVIRDQVQNSLHLVSRPRITATQVGETDVVNISATAGSRHLALAEARATNNAYAALRQRQLQTELRSAIAQVQLQLADVRRSLASAGTGTGASVSQSALQSEYENLLNEASTLQLSQGDVSQAVETLQPATIQTSGISAVEKYAGGGAILGAIIAVSSLFLLRRFRPKMYSSDDVSVMGLRALVPDMPRETTRVTPQNRRLITRAARLLAARLVPAGGRRTPVFIVGSTSSVGTSYVAAALANQLVETGRVLLLLASEASSGPSSTRPRLGVPDDASSLTDLALDDITAAELEALATATRVPGVYALPCGPPSQSATRHLMATAARVLAAAEEAGFLVVIDAPPLDRFSSGVELAKMTGGAILVVGKGVSTPMDVLSAADIMDARGVPFVGAVLNDIPPTVTGRQLLATLRRWAGRRSALRDDASPVTASTTPLIEEREVRLSGRRWPLVDPPPHDWASPATDDFVASEDVETVADRPSHGDVGTSRIDGG